jgi:hypothetical protein
MTLLIDNFSMDIGDWTPTADFTQFYADVTDDIYTVVSGGTYFLREGVQVTTTYSGITNGYRIFYDPDSLTASGVITITVRGENNNSDVEIENYYLLYGYNLKFEDVVDWGINQEVVVWAQATNEVQCPNTEATAFHFITKDYEYRDLSATIAATESVDLGATIYPQSTTIFYSKTYTITVSGIRDYSGNIMDPYEFTFTIEDPPS